MSKSIIDELASESAYLREQYKNLQESIEENSNLTSVPVEVETLSDFMVTEELANKLKISGILLAEGIWNGVLYTKEELKKMYNKFKDKLSSLPLRVEHNRTKEFKNKIIGKNTNVEWSDTLGSILYEAEITDPKAIKLVQDYTFPATSMKTQLRKMSDGVTTRGVDYKPIDNSLTESPACHSCVIVSKEELSSKSDNIPMYRFYGIIKETDLNIENDNNIKEEVDMSKEVKELIKENFELSEAMVMVLPEDEVIKEVELELMTLSQALKRKRVIYEYLPPGSYPTEKRKVQSRRAFPEPKYYKEIDVEEEKDEYGCILGKEEWDNETEKCVLVKDEPIKEKDEKSEVKLVEEPKEEPVKVEPKEEPVKEVPAKEEPVVEKPIVETPKEELPKEEPPKEEPKEEPVVEEPAKVEPVKEEPKAEPVVEPKVEPERVEVPVTPSAAEIAKELKENQDLLADLLIKDRLDRRKNLL